MQLGRSRKEKRTHVRCLHYQAQSRKEIFTANPQSQEFVTEETSLAQKLNESANQTKQVCEQLLTVRQKKNPEARPLE